MKKILLSLTILAAACSAISAQSMSTMLIPTDAKSMSMAASTVALSPDQMLDAEAVFGKWAPKAADNMMAGLYARFKVLKGFSLSLDGTYFRDKPYDVTTSEGRSSGQFTPSEMLFGLGGKFNVAEYLSMELKAKVFMSTLASDVKGNAFGADLLVRYHGQGFNVAAGACNLGTPIKYGSSKDSYAMPMMAKVGGSYTNSGITATAEVDYLFSGALMAGLGLEYCIKEIAYIRAGYHYGDAQKALPSFASVGLGAKFSGVKINFAYMLANKNIGGSLLAGIGYAF